MKGHSISLILRFTLLTSILLLGACKNPVSFSKYQGVNFINSNDLSSWLLMPDFNFSKEGSSVTDYMSFKASSEAGPDGKKAYLLEIKNLLKNGDFEESSSISPWVVNPSTGSGEASVSNLSTDNPIQGYSLKFNLGEDGSLMIPFTTGLIDNTYIKGKKYTFNLDYRVETTTSLYMVKNDDTLKDDQNYIIFGGENGAPTDQSENNINAYPSLSPQTNENNQNFITASQSDNDIPQDSFGFKSTMGQSGIIDNFQIIRCPEGDFDLRLQKNLLSESSEGKPQLIDGYYKFSIWVKAPNSLEKNQFHTDRIELRILGKDPLNQTEADINSVFYISEELASKYENQPKQHFRGNWTDKWIKLYIESQFIQISKDSNEPILSIFVSPSNPGSSGSSWNRLSAGTILISNPSLSYSETPW